MKKLEIKFIVFLSFVVFLFLVVWGLKQKQVISKKAVESPPGIVGDFTADKIFGQPDFKSNSPNQVVNNRVFHPQGLAIDKSTSPNKIYVWDSGNHRILGLTAGKQEADLVFGQPDMHHASCNGNNTEEVSFASASSLCSQKFGQISLMESPQPNSMAVDQNHNLYAFDPYNNRVLKYNNPYSSDTIADFVWGQPDFESRQSNQGRPIWDLNNQMLSGDYGVGVDVDNQGNVWVADSGNKRVLRFPPASKEADLVLGQTDFTSRNEFACGFCYKDQIDIDKREGGSCQGPFSGTIPATALPPQQSLCMPRAVKISPRTGQVYVLDWSGPYKAHYFRILIYNPPFINGQTAAETIIGNGHPRFPVSLGLPLYRPTAIEIDFQNPDAFWIVAGYNRLFYLQKIAGAWQITKQLTDGLESPGGVALDSMGNVYTDTLHGGQEIKRFRAPIPTTCPSCPAYPYDARILKSQDSAFASPNKVSGAGLRDPSNVLLANYNNGQKQMFVSDRSRVLIWNDYENKNSGSSADGVLFEPNMETLSSAGKSIWTMYKDALDRIWMAGADGEIFVFQGPIVSGQAPFNTINSANLFLKTGERIQTGGAITGIVYNENENALWIADTRKHRLIRIANPLEENSKVDMVIGQPNNNSILANRGVDNDDDQSNSGWAVCSNMAADGFGNISGLFYDNFKNLYVADGSREGWQCSNNRLLEFDRETLIPDPNKVFFQQGQKVPKRVYGGSGFTNKNEYQDRDNIPYTPIAVAFNNKNEMLIVADGYSNNYQKRSFFFSNPLPECSVPCRVTDSVVLLIPGAQLSSPSFDKAGNLAILDHTWNRVLYFEKFPSSPNLPTLAPVSPMPTVTIAPARLPTLTPTPPPLLKPVSTPTLFPINPYCPTFGFYPYGPYQDQGRDGNTDNLSNTYSKYVSFTVSMTSKVNGLAIKAGNWGGEWRTVFCKVANASGTADISQESSAEPFRSDSGVQWRKIAFPAEFILIGRREYRLYCRGSDASDTDNMVYWIYDPTRDANNDLAKLFGRTYAVCMRSYPCGVCDFTGDGKICYEDINLIGSCFGQPVAGNCARYDINKDGKNNILDIAFCAGCADRACSASPTPTPR